MSHQIIQTTAAPAAIGPYSQGLVAGPWLFVSGQLGMLPATGELISSEFADQARQALKNLKQIILEADFDLTMVTSVDVFMTDLAHFVEFNRIYGEFFEKHHPARAVIEVSALPKDACVEIKCAARRIS